MLLGKRRSGPTRQLVDPRADRLLSDPVNGRERQLRMVLDRLEPRRAQADEAH
jgi:hypothetical protein